MRHTAKQSRRTRRTGAVRAFLRRAFGAETLARFELAIGRPMAQRLNRSLRLTERESLWLVQALIVASTRASARADERYLNAAADAMAAFVQVDHPDAMVGVIAVLTAASIMVDHNALADRIAARHGQDVATRYLVLAWRILDRFHGPHYAGGLTQ